MTEALRVFAAHCSSDLFPGFPNWSRGLSFNHNDCTIKDFSLGDIWIILANITRMVLFLAGLLSVIFIIVGGIMFITSAGNPDQIARARKVLTNAVVGLVITIFASTIIGYIASLFG